jgi:hypothetical protein
MAEYPYAAAADRRDVADALTHAFREVAPLGLLPGLLGRGARAGVLCALGRESLARPQAVPVADPDTGAPDPRLCWAYAHLWAALLRGGDGGGGEARAPTATAKLHAKHRRRRGTYSAAAAVDGGGSSSADAVVAAAFGFLVSEALLLVHQLELDGSTSEGGDWLSGQALNHDFLLNLTNLLEVTRSRVDSSQRVGIYFFFFLKREIFRLYLLIWVDCSCLHESARMRCWLL